ncbi:unnamed protein product [Symbiodinium natans]|uniref:Uncharacterized protein n=1 Tax=Symbiodinium natans TaxID=878477 RepID=A0A812JIF9_9DINO|nr:unnamed protein product [Symbiodinium natans]
MFQRDYRRKIPGWKLMLDIGRTTFTMMPFSWAAIGSRLELPVAVEFAPGGALEVVGVGDFLGDWLAPDEVPSFVKSFALLAALFPQGPERPLKPTITEGRWEVAAEDPRLVRFFLTTSGFRRDDLWLPEGQLRFRAKAYGSILAQGSDATVTIRESRALFGAAFGAFAGLTLGPGGVVVCAAVAGYALRRVAIVIGEWRCERCEERVFQFPATCRDASDDVGYQILTMSLAIGDLFARREKRRMDNSIKNYSTRPWRDVWTSHYPLVMPCSPCAGDQGGLCWTTTTLAITSAK